MPRDQRSVREQFNKLLKDFENKKNKDERASGINIDPPTENEIMLEEIVEAMESTPLRVENANSRKDDKKRKEALASRDKAMTTWAKAGASGDVSDSEHESDTEKNTVKRRGRKRKAISDPFQRKQRRKQTSEKKSWNFKDNNCNSRLSNSNRSKSRWRKWCKVRWTHKTLFLL